MTQNRFYSNVANVTTLTNAGGINNTTTNIIVAATTGFPTSFPFMLRLEPGTLNEECVLVNSGSGTSGSPYSATRGWDGTPAVAHGAGVIVKHGFSQVDFQEPAAHLNAVGPGGSPNPHGLPDLAWNNTLSTMIGTVSVASTTSTITFSSIPSSYKNLRIYWTAISSTTNNNANLQMNFNGSTTAYDYEWIIVNNSTTPTGAHTGNTTFGIAGFPWGNGSTTIPGSGVIHIPGYSGTLEKRYTFEATASDTSTVAWILAVGSGGWTGTAAINQISFTLNLGSFLAGSLFSLYGDI